MRVLANRPGRPSLPVGQGVTQGDALSAIIFDLVYTGGTCKVLRLNLKPGYKGMERYLSIPLCLARLPVRPFYRCSLVAIHDDTCFVAPLSKLIEINNFLIESAAARRCRRFAVRPEERVRFPARRPHAPLLGQPVWTWPHCVVTSTTSPSSCATTSDVVALPLVTPPQ